MAAVTRVQRTAAATLSHTWTVGEDPIDPTGTPTYAITDANGTAVTSGNATVVTGQGRTTAVFAGRSTLDLLTVTWSATIAGTAMVEVDYVEVVGGFFFSLAEGRASDSTLANTAKYPTADVESRRLDVEVECEEICDLAFVPRYRRLVLDGSGTSDIVVSDHSVRTIRRAAMAPFKNGTFTDLTTTQLSAVAVMPDKVLRKTDGSVWTEGYRNIVVEYEYGLDRPPADLIVAAKTRLRTRLNIPLTQIPDRVISFSTPDGNSYRIGKADAYMTGIPDVDSVYQRYSLRPRTTDSGTTAGEPAARTLTYEPQRYSLYH